MKLRLALLASLVTSAACVVLQDNPRYVEPPAGTYSATRVPVAIGSEGPAIVECAEVSSDFFKAAQVQPLLGRFFIDAEHQGAPTRVAIVSHQWWQDRFGGAPDVIGRTLQIDDRRTTVVGIAPRGFDVPPGTALWIPRTPRQAP
jgi:hypothetical protein